MAESEEDGFPPTDSGPSKLSGPSFWAGFVPRGRLQVAVAAVAGLFLAAAAGYLLGVESSDAEMPPRDSADVGFLYDMSEHHLQAVKLSMIELANGTDPSIQIFAQEIVRAQSWEVGLMQMRLAMWGQDPADLPDEAMAWMGMATSAGEMPGMVSASELEALIGAKGADADALFIALMRDHHAGGVAMAEAAAAKATDEWVAETATRMAAVQAQEIREMEIARDRAGLAANPEGFEADVVNDHLGDSEGEDGEESEGSP